MSVDYWNHNTAYHKWLIDIASQHRGTVLDVGCGDGLLAQRLSPVSTFVTAIEPDANAAARAAARLASLDNVAVVDADFDAYQSDGARFDLITFVASLHHMDMRSALTKARELLTPTGEIAVVGLSANKSATDWLWALACLPVNRIASRLHGETRDIGVVVTDPQECLSEIRRTVDDVLPGAQITRGLYYRYLLRWRR
ncbi:SAM-dependent methyltransferase [Mycolicibacterium agri]|uniref:Methyltransferase n=1 Tax=Mycolicibacterium agri TaxID=36811 RepID=A0A2A7MND7_MYCAG|nr:class I SAM-dependent methyltransferase [Mycolicibacterium agri]PEG33194.1 SAM-dependent methyltransferase [Mycolicibacterium agri]GFG51097.1 methyltransferase [Mycolicibacterium agri]